ncbi:MAG: hypothetical protein WCY88_12155 [Spongiibacteraceae bacterium]
MPTKNAVKATADEHLDYADAKLSLNETYKHLKEARSSAKQAAYAAGSCASDKARDQLKVGKEKVSDLSHEAGVVLKNKPLAVVGTAFLAGFLVSHLLKKS